MKRRTGGSADGWIVAIVTALLSAYPTIRLSAQCPDGSPPPCRPAPSRTAPPPAPNSIAVLYFDNLSRDTADAYLAEGLTDELIATLGRIERLSVKSRVAVRPYRGVSLEPAALGRALGVVHLLSGSVQRSGARLRITVELVRAATGVGVWGEQYDRTEADLLVIREQLARAVAGAVVGRLLPEERGLVSAQPTRDPRAYDRFLRGNYLIAQRNRVAVARAIAEYEAAAQLDPGFTAAHAQVAFAYGMFHEHNWAYPGISRDSILERAVAAADRALQIDSSSSEAWLARGEMLSYRYPRTLDSAVAAYRRALVIDPHNAQALHSYGLMLEILGDDSGAVTAYHRALAVEPERPVTLHNLGLINFNARRYHAARDWLDSALVVDRGFVFAYELRSRARLLLGELREARSDAETAVQLAGKDEPRPRAWPALVAARAGDTIAARQRVAPLRREAPARWAVAMVLVALGDTAEALDILERVEAETGESYWHWRELRSPEFDPLRENPRFRRLVEESRPR